MEPIASVHEISKILPPFHWIVSDGTFWIMDWCTLPDRIDLAEVAVTSLLVTGLERSGPMPCPYTECCRGAGAQDDQIGQQRDPDLCHLEYALQRAWGLSLSDFERYERAT